VVENSVKLLPQPDLVSALNLVEEPINSGDCLAFVIASQNDNLKWIPDFEGKEQANDLAALLPSVDIVSHE
jgi:hypothetical protein